MKQALLVVFGSLLLYGCQSLPSAEEGIEADAVYLSASHCLNEYLDDLEKVHYGPGLKVISINGEEPAVREDGFIEIPAATALTIGVSCVYRHADGSPIPATMENAVRHPRGPPLTSWGPHFAFVKSVLTFKG